MRVGVISDIHSNIIALEAVLAELTDVEMIICAGDIVGYNPWPGECIDRVREEGIPTVMGNHDRMVASDRNFHGNSMARAGVTHAKNTITESQREWLASLPTERVVRDGAIKIVHGHPKDPDHYTRPEEFSPSLLGSESVLIMGHTHVQYHETYPEGTVMNPGSVGQPRDGDPRAAYAILTLPSGGVEEHRVTYDIETVIDEIETIGLPYRTGTRLRKGH